MSRDFFGLQKRGRAFRVRMLAVAIPITLQFFISISLNLVDSLMIGRLGVYPMAAAGAANEIWYLLSISTYGLCSGAGVYIAQYWGAGDIPKIRKVVGISYCGAGGFVLAATVLIWIFAPKLIWLFSREKEIIELGTSYIRIVCISYPISCASDVISYASRAIQKLSVTTLLSCAAIICNVVLNYGMIYGKLGLPKWGIQGAAVATLIARTLQCVGLFVYVYVSENHPLAARPSELLSFNKQETMDVLRVSLPVMASEGGWSLANSLYYVAYGMIGPTALAGAQVVVIVGKMVQSVFGGLANAAGVLIGETLGRGEREEAQSDGLIFVKLFAALGVVFTILMFLSGDIVADWYHFDAETTKAVSQGIHVFSAFILVKMLGYLCVCGILRSGGDTRFCMLVDLGTSWLIAVPAVFTAVLIFDAALPAAIACVYCSEIVKAALCLKRFFSRRWMKIDVT